MSTALLIICGVALLGLGLALRVWPKVKQTHIWRRRLARKVFKDMCNRPPAPAELFTRVRAMDPLAFEELVMEALERRGLKVRRSASYSGDGGKDGEVKLKGAWHLLQMKRYAGNINPKHVRDFISLCQKKKRTGVFIHTGKTTPASKDALSGADEVAVVSGTELVALLTGEAFDFRHYGI